MGCLTFKYRAGAQSSEETWVLRFEIGNISVLGRSARLKKSFWMTKFFKSWPLFSYLCNVLFPYVKLHCVIRLWASCRSINKDRFQTLPVMYLLLDLPKEWLHSSLLYICAFFFLKSWWCSCLIIHFAYLLCSCLNFC